GNIAFFGGFNDNNLSTGIFIASPKGDITKVIDNSSDVPNHPGTFFSGFGNIHLADDGTMIFQGSYKLNGLRFDGLYEKSSVGLKVIFDQFDGLVVNGKHISLVNEREQEVLRMFLDARFAHVDVVHGTRRVAFLQELSTDVRFPRSGIFVAVQR